jgi:two-component system, NtrC family, response regulator PilR
MKPTTDSTEELNRRYRILVVDDEESLREVLGIMLRREGYRVDLAADGAQADQQLLNQDYDLIISDIKMPRMGGMELLAKVKERTPETVMIMVTAFSSTDEAVEAMKQGAYDYITKPFRNEEIRLVVQNALERKILREENREMKKELGERYSFGGLIGKSRPMQKVYELIEKVAASNVNVLISGESGTGKELVARAVHHQGKRSGRPFVPVNCGAIPENLLESELFGHEKGSFTGAIQQKRGLFEVADGGTLFLDEIGELPPAMQVKLLRVLQEREIRRVGGTRDLPVDVRLVAATNKTLAKEVAAGRFREDLFYRLNVIPLELPPLRDRRQDIPLLIEYFYGRQTGQGKVAVSEGAMRRLLDYAWPGNIRELENVIERCVVLGHGKDLSEDCLPDHIRGGSRREEAALTAIPVTGLDLDAYLGEIERDILVKALERCGGVRKKAAELLGITFRSIRYRLAKFAIAGEDDMEDDG